MLNLFKNLLKIRFKKKRETIDTEYLIQNEQRAVRWAIFYYIITMMLGYLAAAVNAYRNGFNLWNNFLMAIVFTGTMGFCYYYFKRHPQSKMTKYLLMFSANIYQFGLVLATHGANKEVYLITYVPVVLSGVFYKPGFVVINTIMAVLFSVAVHMVFPQLLPGEYLVNILSIRLMILIFLTITVWYVCKNSWNMLLRISHESNEAVNRNRQLKQLLLEINEQSQALLSASNDLKESARETGKSASQVAQAMEDLAKGSTDQTNQINQAVEIISQLTEMVRKVSGDTDKIADSSKKVAGSAKFGQQATLGMAKEINEIFYSSEEVGKVVDELSKTSSEISEITAMIGNVAEETSLLALNASIEAARAGEHGRGFEIVAKRTGKLAEQTKKATDMIEKLTLQMKRRTESAVTAIQKEILKVESGKNLASKTNVLFEEIFESLMQNLSQIEAVTKFARQMAEKNENAILAITSVAAISEESMAGTQEVLATSEQQSAMVQEVTALAENLSQIAEKLKQSVAVLETDSPEDSLKVTH
ncbi:MAG: methyl-accepting chemotaxis protein [Bacillota bacterium]